MTDNRSAALTRLMDEKWLGEREASNELKRRIRLVKAIIALDSYAEWARERGLLLGGPALNTVNYERVHAIVESKPYGSNRTFVLSTWDVLDLFNTRSFNEYRLESGVIITLDEILFLTNAEYHVVRNARGPLMKKRSQLCQ